MALTLVQQIQQTKLIKDNDCLLVGLSGGPDSVCLLHALTVLREQMSLTIYAAHLNHNLRGMDADQDAVFAVDCPLSGKKRGY
jgi:tRNA(Ile)-lysidine synthase